MNKAESVPQIYFDVRALVVTHWTGEKSNTPIVYVESDGVVRIGPFKGESQYRSLMHHIDRKFVGARISIDYPPVDSEIDIQGEPVFTIKVGRPKRTPSTPYPFTFSKATTDRVQARIAETQAALNWSETTDASVHPLEASGKVVFKISKHDLSAETLAEALRSYFTLRVSPMYAPGVSTATDRYSDFKTITITGDLAPQPPAPVQTVLNQTTPYEVEMDSHGSLGKKVDEWHGVWEERRKFAIEALKDATVKETQQYWQGRVDAFTDVVGDLNTWYEHYLQ